MFDIFSTFLSICSFIKSINTCNTFCLNLLDLKRIFTAMLLNNCGNFFDVTCTFLYYECVVVKLDSFYPKLHFHVKKKKKRKKG